MKILVLEDEPLTRKYLISEILEHRPKMQISECKDFKEVETKSEAIIHDLALLDMRIGGRLDGIKAANFLRSKGTHNIIFLTAYSDEEMIRCAAAVKPKAFLTKPINTTQLMATLDIIKESFNHDIENDIWLGDVLKNLDQNFKQMKQQIHLHPSDVESEKIIDRIILAENHLNELRTKPSREAFEHVLNHICVIHFSSKKLLPPMNARIEKLSNESIAWIKEGGEKYIGS